MRSPTLKNHNGQEYSQEKFEEVHQRESVGKAANITSLKD